MTCSTTTRLCGVLTIETGFGPGAYNHTGGPGLHGLWPETGGYGTSACVPPVNTSFDQDHVRGVCAYLNDDPVFARHEWEKHGLCAGGPGPASAFMAEACRLAAPVVARLQDISTWEDTVTTAHTLPYPLWAVDDVDKQLLFSVCSQGDGSWNFCILKNVGMLKYNKN